MAAETGIYALSGSIIMSMPSFSSSSFNLTISEKMSFQFSLGGATTIMIDARRQIHTYRSQGLEWEQGFDSPGTVYPEHAHEATRLYTIFGSLDLVLHDEADGIQEITLLPGEEVVIEAGQVHSGVVGELGWKYVAAWNPEDVVQTPIAPVE